MEKQINLYWPMMQHRRDIRYWRLHLVQFAQAHGNKPAARAFGGTVKTVRKWRRRYNGTLDSLADQSKAPKHPAHPLNVKACEKALALKRKLITFGAHRIKRDFKLPLSEKTIRRLWHENGLLKQIRRKHRTKQDLRAVKAQWKLFEQSCVDTKDLIDIPEYYTAMRTYRLPKVQYTFREVKSGLQFIAYASERSLLFSELFIDVVLSHLKVCGIRFKHSRIQSDNGSEFIGSWQARHESGFTQTVHATHGLSHTTIPPKAHTWQADVETVHGLIENEFYRIESFDSMTRFMDKATQYILYFNIARPNSYKNNQTPWQIIHQLNSTIHPKIVTLPAFYLDHLWKFKLEKNIKRGYDLIQYP